MQNDFESPRELAQRLSWPLARVRRLIRDRELRHVKLGGLYLVPAGAIEEYLAARTVMPHPPGEGGSV
ncbi:excisionase family DNA-binding protein [Paracoccus sp. (in: a-proteobacteria)]|uniref:excisionase family DNA-binding protein n=1 Tax=Paracoccus sp. TaxID=267 RepID=UPI003A5221AF